MTHAFMYGTAVFEGIRAYWNAEHGQLYALRVREHMERIRNSARILLMEDLPSVDQLTGEALEVLRRNGFREDTYVRPSFYKSTPGDRREAPWAGASLLHPRPAVRRLRRHHGRREDRNRLLAPDRGHRHSVAGQDRGQLRQPSLQQVRGDAQRLRRGPRPDRGRPRLRRVRGEHLRHSGRRGS